ncbi:ABC transporter substrate-binding protein [Anthocerotibacter panamensis]|uniref:ABC transporter substrate-binding protein n=1 Tax=Anthocerotibacter panamensis TaxID=2857077 RepID=UPI001FD87CF3|nr:ABC transporter substrate-binding protein [Anthocerotibacter panamensis]
MANHYLRRLLLPLLLPFWLLTACQSSTPTATAPATSTTTVKLGFSAWPGWFPWQVAEEKGLFAKNGVKVELVWFEGYLDSINALAGGKLDANSQTLNDTLSSVAAGAEQVIVLVNDNSTGNDKIIVKAGITSVKDLKGKKVAAELGTVDHYLLLLGLEKEGLSPKDINFQPLETGAAAAAFVSGKLDAVGVFAPFTTTALKRSGSKALFTSKEFPGAIPDHLVFTKKFVTEHPEEVQKLVTTWYDTLDYIKANPAEAVQIMAKRAGVTPAEYQDYDSGTTIFTLQQNLQAFAPGDDITHLNFAANRITDFLVRSGLTKTKAKLEGILDDRFVKEYAKQKGATP